jgi:hypothetical protein
MKFNNESLKDCIVRYRKRFFLFLFFTHDQFNLELISQLTGGSQELLTLKILEEIK